MSFSPHVPAVAMTEPTVPHAVHDVEQEYSASDDRTEPTNEILNVLNQLNSQNNQTNIKAEPLDNVLPSAPPPTEYDALIIDLKEKPHNPERWRRLVELAEQSGEIDKVRASYDALLLQYPNTVCDPCPIPLGARLISCFNSS
jgi:cleavage stimulation factor subunit 3